MARAEVPAASGISPMALPLLDGAMAIGCSPRARRGDLTRRLAASPADHLLAQKT